MIEFRTGNLFDAETQALVNTVNTQGVMGKGIALQFKERFRQNFKLYQDACKRGELEPGKLLIVTEHLTEGDRIIINFPTKVEWFRRSQYNWIEAGLAALAKELMERSIQSVALPPLGCGNGGLKWEKIRPMIEKFLGELPILVVVYEPNEDVKATLQQEQAQEAASKPAKSKLTAARAMLLHALWHQVELGEEANVFAANKLAYFLQEEGEPLRLNFVPHHYGPYDQAVEKVLYALNGEYLSGLEQMDAKPFEALKLHPEKRTAVEDYVSSQLTPEQQQRLSRIFQLISGFESSLSLEILSTVHFVRKENRHLNALQLHEKISEWNERKAQVVKPKYVQVALERLVEFEHAQGRLF